VLTGGLMFEHLGHPEAAAALKHAVRTVLASTARTPDLGGDASTGAVVSALGNLV
jgi:isocitrate/isopropylmalate dehydrogenase